MAISFKVQNDWFFRTTVGNIAKTSSSTFVINSNVSLECLCWVALPAWQQKAWKWKTEKLKLSVNKEQFLFEKWWYSCTQIYFAFLTGLKRKKFRIIILKSAYFKNTRCVDFLDKFSLKITVKVSRFKIALKLTSK